MARTVRLMTMAALASVAALLVSAATLHAADLSSPDRAIEGIWRLDAAQSDDPARLRLPGAGPGAAQRGPHGSGRQGGPPGGMHGADKPSPADSAAMLRGRPLWRLRHPARQVVVFMMGEQVELTEDERPMIEFAMQDSLEAHGREAERPMGAARWKAGLLVTQSALGNGRYLIESYEVSQDGATLTIRSRAEAGPDGASVLDLRRVYRRYEGE